MEHTTPRLERLRDVLARIGISRSELYRRLAAGKFPKPVQLGERAVAWSSAEVDQYIEGLLAGRHVAVRDEKAA